MATNTARAVEVVTDKLWITYDARGNKTGIIRVNTSDSTQMLHCLSDGSRIAYDRETVHNVFEFVQRDAEDNLQQNHVFGYPVAEGETFSVIEQDSLPTYTKTVGSRVYFAAGYYGINFTNGGWMDAFCPKLSTLEKYEYVGPFRTLTDAQLAIRRKERQVEQ